MKDWKSTLVSSSQPIIEALKIITHGAARIALVVDREKYLLGTVTDGDVRSGILKGIALDAPVEKIMCQTPIVSKASDSRDKVLGLMKKEDVLQIPIVDDQGHVIGMKILRELLEARRRENIVVLMAGGRGQRLRPITRDCPKPLVKIGNKPVLQTIIENFIKSGFYRFYISVNYKAEMIESHFKDGSEWKIEIEYLRENHPMGTAGALGLIADKPQQPFIVMNGDLLTNVDFNHLLEYHSDNNANATMCVRNFELEVPYGVIAIENNLLRHIDEKPMHSFFINAGIYVLEPAVLDEIPKNVRIDMTTVLEKKISNGDRIVAFPIREYWIDIGEEKDFIRANGEYFDHF